MTYKISLYEDSLRFEKWAKENNIAFEEVDERCYIDSCPKCGDDEFWEDGHCNHCGYCLGDPT